ncbi:MAG: lipoate--protein ligase family protein [candidate division Zixibacteria bacterium]|nr:lipoate--protein ligase family protein [candidate division Zixibacteria bacterium]
MKEQKCRFIYTGVNNPYFNMAVDEVLLNSAKNRSITTLRLYEWNPATVSIGYFQAVKKTADLNKCDRAGIKIVRRITGGRAVLHNKELTYSFCGNLTSFPELGRNISETYQQVSSALLLFLMDIGIKAECASQRRIKESSGKAYYNMPCFSSFSRYEISFQGKKLIGSAQRRFEDSFLQHGSILLNENQLKLIDFLPLDFPLEKNKLDKNFIYIEEIIGKKVDKQIIINSINRSFNKFFLKDFNKEYLTDEELKETGELIRNKYSSDSWTFKF